MHQKVVTVFGATGFIGRYAVRALAAAGYTVRAVTRNTQKAYFLRTLGDVGQIVPMRAEMNEPGGVDACVRGSDAVVYLPGILNATRAKDFKTVHVDYPAQIAEACMRFDVRRFVHVSSLAAGRGTSLYAQSKFEGEAAVMNAFPQSVILRPSLVVGPEDGFFGRFAKMARVMPFMPLIGGGKTKFQPVYVGDVAQAILAAITLPSTDGRIYELGGPDVFTFKELMQKLFVQTKRSRPLLPVPFALAGAKAALLQCLPGKLLTRDQVKSLKADNIADTGAPGLTALGVTPTALDTILPATLARFRPGSPASQQKQAA